MNHKKRTMKRLLSFLLVPALCTGMGAANISQLPNGASLTSIAAFDDSKVIYVAETGSDSNGDGSKGKPYRSIAKAASMATAGTTVLVGAGTYVEESITPKESGRKDAMIIFRPETQADVGKVIIKHRDTFTGSTITPEVRAQWLRDTGWKEDEVKHYDNAGIEYSIAGRKNELTDVFSLFHKDYIWIEGFVFKDYKYARNTINIKGTGNVVINNRFEDIGCVYNSIWHWTANGCLRGDVTVPVAGSLNVVRNNIFQNVYGETMCYEGSSNDNIIAENTFIGAIGKNGGAQGSESSTLGGRFFGNKDNAFAFNYSGGSVNGGTIWLDISVRDFTAVRNVAHNTAYFMFNESECTRNWAYENIVYNKPLDNNKRMPASDEFFTDFPAQRIESGLFSAFWDTGSTWDARWVNNVTYNLKNGISLDRSYNNEVRNNISYEDDKSMYNKNETVGIVVKETTVNGFHPWHGVYTKGGGFHIFRNNMWYSPRKTDYVRYMDPSQPYITVDAFNKQTGSNNLDSDPMFENAAGYDFRLKPGSPAIGAGDGGVDMGAYAVYPKTDVGYNKDLKLTEDVNVSFDELNSSVVPGDTIELKLNLSKPAAEKMEFKVTPVAGDARPEKDYSFVDDPSVTFNPGDTSKTVRVKILDGYDLDQLLVFRIVPVGTTKLENVGGRDMHLVRIQRAKERILVLSQVGDSMGTIVASYHKPGELVTIDAKSRPGYVFDRWQVGIEDTKLTPVTPNGSVSTFIMPDQNQRIQVIWKPEGQVVNNSGISLDQNNISLNAGDSQTLKATVTPDNATDKVVIWRSTNPLVASVDKNGKVTGLSNGSAEIIATALDTTDKQYTARCKVSVAGTITSLSGKIEAEDYTVQSGTDTENCSEGGKDVAYIENGDYLGFKKVDFKDGASSLEFRVGATGGEGTIEVHLGSPDGQLIGKTNIAETGGWQNWETQTCNIEKTTGEKDVYLVFKGTDGYLFNLNWWNIVYGDAPVVTTTTAPVTTTKALETTTDAPIAATLIGDANLDKRVSIADAVAILQSIANKDKYALTPQAAANADCFDPGDGVTGNDALAIQKLDAGLYTKLPVTE